MANLIGLSKWNFPWGSAKIQKSRDVCILTGKGILLGHGASPITIPEEMEINRLPHNYSRPYLLTPSRLMLIKLIKDERMRVLVIRAKVSL
jgi:hypothetical protein